MLIMTFRFKGQASSVTFTVWDTHDSVASLRTRLPVLKALEFSCKSELHRTRSSPWHCLSGGLTGTSWQKQAPSTKLSGSLKSDCCLMFTDSHHLAACLGWLLASSLGSWSWSSGSEHSQQRVKEQIKAIPSAEPMYRLLPLTAYPHLPLKGMAGEWP